jgi:hypothetical protein
MMTTKNYLRTAAILLFIFGSIELMGLMVLLIPSEYLPENLAENPTFWALISGLYGIARIIAGVSIWRNQKWGVIFGLLLTLTTMIVAPTMIPSGVMDLVLAIVITICLLRALYGNKKVNLDE